MKITTAGKGIRIEMSNGRHITLEEKESKELRVEIAKYFKKIDDDIKAEAKKKEDEAKENSKANEKK